MLYMLYNTWKSHENHMKSQENHMHANRQAILMSSSLEVVRRCSVRLDGDFEEWYDEHDQVHQEYKREESCGVFLDSYDKESPEQGEGKRDVEEHHESPCDSVMDVIDQVSAECPEEDVTEGVGCTLPSHGGGGSCGCGARTFEGGAVVVIVMVSVFGSDRGYEAHESPNGQRDRDSVISDIRVTGDEKVLSSEHVWCLAL